MKILFEMFILLLASASLVFGQKDFCSYGTNHPLCRDHAMWRLGVDHARGGGAVVHGQASRPLGQGVSGNVHGQRVFGGPNNGAQSVGGGLNYNHPNGLHGSVDATHYRGQGNQFSAQVGGSTRVGPGTLSIGGGIDGGSGKPQTNVGATYSVPLN